MSPDAAEDHEANWTRLYVARWPDGTAMIISAASMAEVAGRLDEVGDPGTCEVVPFDGPIALVVRPRPEPGEALLDVALDALDDALDVQRAIMAAAFPALYELIEQSRDDGGEADVARSGWAAAAAREGARELAPSAVWSNAIKEWWEEMSGAPAHRSAATREHMRVTIPGEPIPEPTMRPHFEAEHRRIRERIDAALMPHAPEARTPDAKPSRPAPTAAPKARTPVAKRPAKAAAKKAKPGGPPRKRR